MRLLRVTDLEFKEFPQGETPPYIIASHRWEEDEAFYDRRYGLTRQKEDNTKGYCKVKGFCNIIRKVRPDTEWLWIDTCCIDKQNHAELTEAINSMYTWYSQAEECYAYLSDVPEREFGQSAWFERGWTLQELLVPDTVVFMNRCWDILGHKRCFRQEAACIKLRRREHQDTSVGTAASSSGKQQHGTMTLKQRLDQELTEAVRLQALEASKAYRGEELNLNIYISTGIPFEVLADFEQSKGLDLARRLEWIDGRATTKPEDMTYSLLGILDVSMAIIYGEGHNKARGRLAERVTKQYEFEIRTKLLDRPRQVPFHSRTAQERFVDDRGSQYYGSLDLVADIATLRQAYFKHQGSDEGFRYLVQDGQIFRVFASGRRQRVGGADVHFIHMLAAQVARSATDIRFIDLYGDNDSDDYDNDKNNDSDEDEDEDEDDEDNEDEYRTNKGTTRDIISTKLPDRTRDERRAREEGRQSEDKRKR